MNEWEDGPFEEDGYADGERPAGYDEQEEGTVYEQPGPSLVTTPQGESRCYYPLAYPEVA